MILRGAEPVGGDRKDRELVLRGGRIQRVGPISTAGGADGPVIDFGDAIAFPGLVNSHDHLEFNLYPALGHKPYADYVEWGKDIQQRDRALISSIERTPRSFRTRWGGLKNLLCGVTAVAHHGSARDEIHGLSVAILPGTSIHSVRWARRWRWKLNAPIARPPYVFHVGEGTSPAAGREVDQLLRWNLLRRPLIGVHAIAMRPEQAGRFRAVVWCPLSNAFLYRKTADAAALSRQTRVLLGTDSTLTADWNFWNHLRGARALGALADEALFDAVTRSAWAAWRLPGAGRIAPGEAADLVFAKKKAKGTWDAFFAVDPEDILLVLRNGTVVLCDSSVDPGPLAGPFSRVRIGATEKRVAEDVPALLAEIRKWGLTSNLPIVEATPWLRG